MIHLILLSGGSGTRLWPLSNNTHSKQFLKVLRDDEGNHVSMVQRVFSQIEKVNADLDVTIATCASQEFSIASQVSGDYSLVIEPERRDTAPAIMLAAEHLIFEQDAQLDDTVIVMPIDTFAGQDYYDSIVKLDAAVQSETADLVLLGVEPTYPSEKYGYIIPMSKIGETWPVEEFKERPSEDAARLLIERGGLWNCGVFAFKLDYVKGIADSYLNASSYEEFRNNYSQLPKISFDYEVVENAENIAVVPYSGEWKDLGTWNTLSEEMCEAYSGRVVVDEDTCDNLHVINTMGSPLVVAGISNAVVVVTPDGILVSGKEESAHIKEQIAEAAESRPMQERRRWGEYRVIESSVSPDDVKALTKELIIESGRQLSYQKHQFRTEVWTVISGHGEVVLDGLVQEVRAGAVVRIGTGKMHAARAFEDLHIIEVQLGDILIEEDIERFGNYWRS